MLSFSEIKANQVALLYGKSIEVKNKVAEKRTLNKVLNNKTKNVKVICKIISVLYLHYWHLQCEMNFTEFVFHKFFKTIGLAQVLRICFV